MVGGLSCARKKTEYCLNLEEAESMDLLGMLVCNLNTHRNTWERKITFFFNSSVL